MSTSPSGPAGPPRELTREMRSLLWHLAQRLYGATPISRKHRLGAADGLVHRGLIKYADHAGRDASLPVVCVTEAGKREITARWPRTPLSLGSYDRPNEGWTPFDARSTT